MLFVMGLKQLTIVWDFFILVVKKKTH